MMGRSVHGYHCSLVQHYAVLLHQNHQKNLNLTLTQTHQKKQNTLMPVLFRDKKNVYKII
jgi:hypothetical protein